MIRPLPFLLLLLLSTAGARYIVPGARWRDTSGDIVNAHAGNIIRDGATGTFYLFGEHKTEARPEGGGVAVYSSPDLATWTPHADLALAPVDGHPYISPESIIQRPKVVHSAATGKYHMWWHADNSSYGLLLQGFATSDNATGPYEFVSATAPLGNWSQDFGLFVDNDADGGRAYALFSNGDGVDARDDYIAAFDEAVTAVSEVTYRFDKYDLEAPAIARTAGGYWALMSHKTGYRPNDVVAFRADALGGPWSQPFAVAPPDTRTYNSQSGYVLRINGTRATTHLYMGDRWDSNALWESRYVWLPMEMDDEAKTLRLVWRDVYDLDVTTGEWTDVEGTSYYAEDAVLGGNAFLQEASFASRGVIATGIYGNDSNVTFTGIQGTGKPQWVSFYYQNTDDLGFGNNPGGSPDRIGGSFQLRRISGVVVNGATANVETLYQHDTNKGVILSTPLLLTLEEGSNNTITVGGLYNGLDRYSGGDLDRIIVYPPEADSNVTSNAVRDLGAS